MLKVRLATDKDYKKVMKLYNDFVGEDRYSNYDNDSYQKVLQNSSNFIYIGEEDAQIIGFAAFSVRNVVRYPKPIAELDEIYINPNFRKQGVGRKLMESVENKAKELNCYRVYIESQYKHEQGHKFYEALGYKNCGYHFYKSL